MYESLSAENPGAYLSDMAMICFNLGVLYSNTERLKEAEEEYLRAKEIYEKLAAKNPMGYLYILIKVYNSLANLYGDISDDQERAIPLLEKMQGLQMQLDTLNRN